MPAVTTASIRPAPLPEPPRHPRQVQASAPVAETTEIPVRTRAQAQADIAQRWSVAAAELRDRIDADLPVVRRLVSRGRPRLVESIEHCLRTVVTGDPAASMGGLHGILAQAACQTLDRSDMMAKATGRFSPHHWPAAVAGGWAPVVTTLGPACTGWMTGLADGCIRTLMDQCSGWSVGRALLTHAERTRALDVPVRGWLAPMHRGDTRAVVRWHLAGAVLLDGAHTHRQIAHALGKRLRRLPARPNLVTGVRLDRPRPGRWSTAHCFTPEMAEQQWLVHDSMWDAELDPTGWRQKRDDPSAHPGTRDQHLVRCARAAVAEMAPDLGDIPDDRAGLLPQPHERSGSTDSGARTSTTSPG
jgi:hypothetical protein